MKPHRGVLILVLGILGLVGCCICAPIAWYMGSQDMAEIEAGRMDPEGKQMTQIGMILGIVGCVLTLLGIIVQVGIMVMAGGMAAVAN
ncbi:DUF4190 domain-containing protein [Bremerella sp. T1]|uniref:DUF4190 domain-containing protein n=1 Tax=Bremerella sp. TYQ1 TaxID=3119568 RepID=UPI001CC909EC|nr:DUF4190 domain-containing protein [Bremerella volcania]UBM35010.1 DUF4190 domain-containing protein [Bremerella volcania]